MPDYSMFGFPLQESFEAYQERFKDFFSMRRERGILEVKMHTRGDVARWSFEMHKAIPAMLTAVGMDRDNEVLILTGTGDYWLREFDPESFKKQENDETTFRKTNYDLWFLDGIKLQESMIWSVDIPTIAAINGPGFHTEFGLLSDLTICADDASFVDVHKAVGLVPGDGSMLVFQHLLGHKRGNYASMLGIPVNVEQALEWGLVNEVHAREKLLARAWEMAEQLMQSSRIVRNLTAQLARRPWKKVFTQDFHMHFASELYGANVSRGKHDMDAAKRSVDNG